MSLSIISPSNKKEEDKILKEIYKSIDTNKSIIFNSGAGSGKTYALIESLRYIINKYEKKLKEHNQKIICITYTNVATKEVKERLGNSDLIKVSTIHERIWDLIKKHQTELVEIHKGKVADEIDLLNQLIKDDKKFQNYRELTEEEQKKFKEVMLESTNKDLFYRNYGEKAKDFKALFEEKILDFPDMLRNVGNFKKIVSTIYKLENYSNCVVGIETRNKGYKTVEYDSTYNSDRLHWMRISHDTILEYGLKIIENYDVLKQIIIDQYPYILIDEYQDTNEKVVKIVNALSEYAAKIKHNLFVGYFGDAAQNIYDDGVGSNINEIHPNLKSINKEFNRRSSKEIIDVINKIRNDEITQKSIYSDCDGGTVKFYTGRQEDTESFKNKYINEWGITSDNKLHCLVLTNKTVAAYSGFTNIYNCFSQAEKYSGYNYQQLNTELLSDDLSKLGDIPVLLFKIVDLRNKLKNSQTAVQEIVGEYIYRDMNIGELRGLIETLKQANGDTLFGYVDSILNIYLKSDNLNFKRIIDKIFEFEKISLEIFQNHVTGKLYPNLQDKDLKKATTNIHNLLNTQLSEYDLWYNFLLNVQNDKVVYHTYHGTKGLEFDNVILIMENAFGRSRNYFNSFFEKFHTFGQFEEKEKKKYEQIQNLLYVSCSRAIKHLRVLYLDDISSFSDGIKKIFGTVHQYQTKH